MRLVLFSVLGLFFLNGCVSTAPMRTSDGKRARQGIAEMRTVPLGNWPQWLLIRGVDTVQQPVLLFLHGGPGASETAMLRKYNAELEQHFTVVYWDQRGTAKSYSKDIPEASMNLAQFLSDADELTDYLRHRFKQNKIFLVGHSWGTVLGIELVKRHPEKYHAYLGVGQVVHTAEGERLSYDYTLQQAKTFNHAKALQELETIGPPVNGKYQHLWDVVKQRKWLLKFGGERVAKRHYRDFIFDLWFSREYTLGDLIRYGKGSGFSAWHLAEDEKKINFLEQAPSLQVPVVFLAGRADFNTPFPLVQQYFQRVQTPYKKFYPFEQSAHFLIFEEPQRFNQVVISEFKAILEAAQQEPE